MRATSYMQHLVKILFMYVRLSILYIRVDHQATPTQSVCTAHPQPPTLFPIP